MALTKQHVLMLSLVLLYASQDGLQLIPTQSKQKHIPIRKPGWSKLENREATTITEPKKRPRDVIPETVNAVGELVSLPFCMERGARSFQGNVMLKRRPFAVLAVGLPCVLFTQPYGRSIARQHAAFHPTPTDMAPSPPPVKESVSMVQIGEASWYGPGFNKKKTANGEIYDQTKLTAAHPTLPEGSTVKITNLENGKSVKVRVNDRGPYVDDRIVDVSRKAAKVLNMIEEGVAKVKIEVLSKPTTASVEHAGAS